MTLTDLISRHGMHVETSLAGTSIGVTRQSWRIEALRWCWTGCETCTCPDWTVLVAPVGHRHDIVVRRNVTGTAALAAAVNDLLAAADGHITQMLTHRETR